MGKAMLHSLIDLLPDADIETIYNVLIRFIPVSQPLPDEIKAIEQAEQEIQAGDVMDFDSIDWDEAM